MQILCWCAGFEGLVFRYGAMMLLESHEAVKALEYTNNKNMNSALSFIPLFREASLVKGLFIHAQFTPQETF